MLYICLCILIREKCRVDHGIAFLAFYYKTVDSHRRVSCARMTCHRQQDNQINKQNWKQDECDEKI